MSFSILNAAFSATPVEGVSKLVVQFTNESVVYDLLVETGSATDRAIENGQATDRIVEVGVS